MQNKITEKELMEYSSRIKSAATELITEKRIISILSKYGEPLIIGSYELDLMIDTDIDIVVQTEATKESAQNALHEFIKNEVAAKYEFGDFIKYGRPNRPKGYIVNLLFEYKEQNWEIEIWFLAKIDSYIKSIEQRKLKLNEANKIAILHAKYERNLLGKSKHEISSFEIYNKILDQRHPI